MSDNKQPMLEGNQVKTEGCYAHRIGNAFSLKISINEAWVLIKDSIDRSQNAGWYPKNGPCTSFMVNEIKVVCENKDLYPAMISDKIILEVVIHQDGSWGLACTVVPIMKDVMDGFRVRVDPHFENVGDDRLNLNKVLCKTPNVPDWVWDIAKTEESKEIWTFFIENQLLENMVTHKDAVFLTFERIPKHQATTYQEHAGVMDYIPAKAWHFTVVDNGLIIENPLGDPKV